MSRLGIGAVATAVACVTASQAEPLAKPVVGPRLVCLKYSSFALLADERITDLDGSPESEQLTVRGSSGTYTVGESEIFATKGLKRLVYTAAGTKVYKVGRERVRYAITGPTSYSDGREVLVVWLAGDALSGRVTDADIYKRFAVGDPKTVKCQSGYTYGWNFN